MRVVEMDVGPVFLDVGEGVWLGVLGSLHRCLATGQATDGAYAAIEVKAFPGLGPPPHIHHRESEMFYVLEGQFELLCGERTVQARPGSFVHIPRGTLHTYKCIGNEPGRFLVVITPAGFEKFFEEIGHPVEDTFSEPPIDPADFEKVMKLAPKYHMEIPT